MLPNHKKVGVLDIGSNSIKLITAYRSDTGALSVDQFFLEETRIGEGMTGTPPVIDPDSISRGTAAVKRLLEKAPLVDTVCIVATSAVRDASNKQEFVHSIEKHCGQTLRILSGDEEAHFIGMGIQNDPKLQNLDAFSLLDLGGGSLECIQFSSSKLLDAVSMQLGAVRLSAKFVKDRDLPLAQEQQDSIQKHTLETWQRSGILQLSSPSPTAVLTGGAAGVIGEMVGIEQKELGISLERLSELRAIVCQSPLSRRIEELKIPASRADIFPAALVTLEASLKYLGCRHLRFSHYNLRYGLAASLLD